MITVLAVLLVIGGVIFIHELGHFTFAKLTGMRVEKFSIGFPPRLFGKKIGDTDYCISAIPLGGYVKVAGVIDESMDVDGVQGNEPWKFESKNAGQKSIYITGGVVFNLLFAALIFCLLTIGAGIYDPSPEPVVDEVLPELPAEAAGIQKGDRILAVNGIMVSSWEDMAGIIHAFPNDTIMVRWLHNENEFEKPIVTISNKILKGSKLVDVGMIGVSPVFTHRNAGFFEAVGQGFQSTWYWLKITVISLKMLITGEESLKNIGGPIFIAQLAGRSAKSGLAPLFGLMAIISVNLAFINILPIPAFDGGHLIIIIIEATIRRPLSIKTKLRIQQIGLAIILTLMAVVFYNDILRLFRGGI
ncbi:MAG: RIP metalloprotease RseP [Candidatus Marinimicrobia bacterium]|nr:RIP metalloprotease RseP [bacterium]MCG2715086.1 RIP metalloprotease RseP [Candidatus Neomarinimicrobiota bacterium]